MAKLSTRYAKALYQLAMEHNELERYLQQAVLVRDALSDARCQQLMNHPDISDAEKRAFLKTAFSGQLSVHLESLLHLAVQKKRTRIIVPALTEFIDMGNRQQGRTTATVVSAAPIDARQRAQLSHLLSQKLKKQVVIKTQTDPALIGGLYIQVDGYLIDRTVRQYLQDIKESVKKGVSQDAQA